MIAHNVYFTLLDRSPAARQKLVDACKQYLTGHPGTLMFACGVLAESISRPVVDRDYDVGLHFLFASMADHDAYQTAPRHLQFVAENRAGWARVRVFDSEVERVP
jgi:hypothetical protein